ncbi:HesB/IscA family protein [Portibacter marinus]|uniref:HesB/IscA family protein n=1 Tax=Portibacter marinus TaxID=2898660 RepID=UPI001F3B1F8E|nr:iron-sulfur cluster assembly accessory protein [Portibacter marinus]
MEVQTATKAQPIHITESAGAQLNRIMQEQNIPEDHALRVGVKGGGCSGFSYILGFDKKKDRDESYEVAGMDVIIDKAHAIYLLGIEIDWMDGLNNRGFVFNNPNAKETCGCGTSFSA